MGICSSQKELELAFSASIERLNSIETGYRQFHKMVGALLKQHPKTVKESNINILERICKILFVKPQRSDKESLEASEMEDQENTGD